MSDDDRVQLRSTEQGRELRDAIAKFKAQREAESAASAEKASAPLPDIDFEAMVKSLPAATLVAVIAVEHVRENVADPGGILRARAVHLDAEGGKAADDEFEVRLIRLLVAASDELNRRIPIPEVR